jgi:hypothetical protein
VSNRHTKAAHRCAPCENVGIVCDTVEHFGHRFLAARNDILLACERAYSQRFRERQISPAHLAAVRTVQRSDESWP